MLLMTLLAFLTSGGDIMGGFVGPMMGMEGGTGIHDRRLTDLQDNVGELEANPSYKDTDGKPPGFLSEMMPLMLSQGLDLASTEMALKQGNTSESNPIPGMQGFPGRLGAQILQAFIFHKLRNVKPEVTDKFRDAATVMHSGAAAGNFKTAEDQRNLYGGR